MPIQILVPLHTYPDGNAEGIALHAAAVAQHLRGQVHALILGAEFPRVSSPFGNLVVDVPTMISETKAKCHARGNALAGALKSTAAAAGVSFRATELSCYPYSVGDVVADHGHYHDLILAGLRPDDETLRITAEAAIFGSGRPVLLVPESHPPHSLQQVTIAWDGSRVAARAVADAREFLRRASSVTVATVVDEKRLPESAVEERLIAYLASHGIQAEAAKLRSDGKAIAGRLQDFAREREAGLLVMGGFGHSRMRDFVLGGATRGILTDPKIPVLISH
ncbi:universal stress protein [Roseomonas marmotae]|uniref:Universal stress protein n=1 Tax=Roseomonas marmotae TaxID=2768161 RepID=A0ABS3KB31_9PROT|nr:universal stress protein [Roseomonas marmotae]MBO1074679.1 universal stress protein [Roseomonas marmotae]QTI81698.1 universal stress protein [Roseomonas marmotae]